MWRLVRIKANRPPKAERQAPPPSVRDRLAMLLGVVTIVCLGVTFLLARDAHFLMPGPLTSAHGAIEKCSACHTGSGSSNLGWFHGLVAGDRIADSKACLTCHQMPDTAFNAHGASAAVLQRSTERLTKVATTMHAPFSARAQSIVSPTDGIAARGLYCTACHQEHQGTGFDIKKISNEQCRSCHVVKFDSFDGDHPKFESYPFRQRTRIIYDHAGHFGKHFPEVAKKDPAKRIPDTCSSCHDSRGDKRVMAVAPFEKTCASCHLDQITGKERVSGPKGIAFLSLPGLDLQTLKKKKASIGEWPDASEAELTPFLKVMISRNARGRALIKTVGRLNLQDLSRANDVQIKAVTSLVWEIKGLYYALISGKASDVLGDLGVGGAKANASVVADLIASLPRDVVVSAQQQWLPNLGTEMANRKDVRAQDHGGWTTKTTTQTGLIVDSAVASIGKTRQPASASRQASTKPEAESVAAQDAANKPEGADGKADTVSAKPSGRREAVAAAEPPRAKAADQTDDLLYPTEEELRASAVLLKGSAKAAPSPDRAVAADPTPKADPAPRVEQDVAALQPQIKTAPGPSIETKVDPESWAEYGGWYRQDYAIFYRPLGHKDKFIYSWLSMIGPHAPKGDKGPTSAIFDALTSKDAQGSCTKCHSMDEIGKGRTVNFSPSSARSKQGRFTHFIHEPHLSILAERGCQTCHSLEKGRPYLQSYQQGNPQSFVSSFGTVKKDLCQTCHTSNMARQDCLTCHTYHVHGVVTPIMDTKLPTE
jgi:hypothetical protein